MDGAAASAIEGGNVLKKSAATPGDGGGASVAGPAGEEPKEHLQKFRTGARVAT